MDYRIVCVAYNTWKVATISFCYSVGAIFYLKGVSWCLIPTVPCIGIRMIYRNNVLPYSKFVHVTSLTCMLHHFACINNCYTHMHACNVTCMYVICM